MSTLPNHVTAPPGGWRYKVPETGQTFTGPSEHSLVTQLRAHYKANGYEFPVNINTLIENYVCTMVPDYCTGNEPARLTEGFSFHTVISGTRTLGSWLVKSLLKGERQYVPQIQADSRAATCAMCIYNDAPQGCTGCNSDALKQAIKLVIGPRSTPYDNQLKSCRICNCQLTAKVHLPHAVLYDNMTDKQTSSLPAHCWLVKEATTNSTP